uniref:Uncharacterized protein n=1 Tax=Mus musculus TaxID=10090 RepID=Q3UTJ9_MOUSE|nr:unnamed protein product [Mus musculus]
MRPGPRPSSALPQAAPDDSGRVLLWERPTRQSWRKAGRACPVQPQAGSLIAIRKCLIQKMPESFFFPAAALHLPYLRKVVLVWFWSGSFYMFM